MAAKYRLCPKCKYRYERVKKKCPSCSAKAPKRRVPKHAQTLRDDSYERYVEVSKAIHGVADESCCVCRKPRSKERRHDRDHDHGTGKPRGLACHLCNRLMPHWMTAQRAQLVANYLLRVEKFYEKLEAKDTKPKGSRDEWESPGGTPSPQSS